MGGAAVGQYAGEQCVRQWVGYARTEHKSVMQEVYAQCL